MLSAERRQHWKNVIIVKLISYFYIEMFCSWERTMIFTWWFHTEWHKPVGQNMGCISRKHLGENQRHLQHLVESKMNLWLQLVQCSLAATRLHSHSWWSWRLVMVNTELRILPPTLGGSSWWEPWKLRISPDMCCTETIWEKKSYLHSHWKEKPWPWPRDSLSCLRHWLREEAGSSATVRESGHRQVQAQHSQKKYF